MFSLSNAIRLMIFIGALAVGLVAVKACQTPAGPLERFAVGSLKKLTSLDAPPAQPVSPLPTPTGEASLEDYRGKIVLLNVWGTWCAPCIAEMPSLDGLERARGGDDFAVVTIAMDRNLEIVQTFYERNDITALPVILDQNYTLNRRLELPGLPTSVFYDRSGREIARIAGEADWTSDEALALVDHLIAR